MGKTESKSEIMIGKAAEAALSLRHELHRNPEPSGRERETAAILKKFLSGKTRCSILESADTTSFCAVLEADAQKRTDTPYRTVAFRADMDGVPIHDRYSHACGHDGHSAILAGFAVAASNLLSETVEKRPSGGSAPTWRSEAFIPGRILFLFQKGEETGEGASEIMEKNLFGISTADRIFGLHNLPGYPHAEILVREDVFAYASEGLVIDLVGAPSHAAYPESGKNPSPVLADLVQFISALPLGPAARADQRSASRSFATIVGMTAGKEAFGTAAADGRLMCTLRGEKRETVGEMEKAITGFVRKRAAAAGIGCSWRIVEPFPETRNDPDCVAAVREAAAAAGLPVSELAEPMRWSEDFGHYTARVPGAFFGLGAGTEQPQLHTADYEFPDSLIRPGIELFSAIAGIGF